MADVALATAPVDTATALGLIDRLAVAPLIRGFRGGDPLDAAALADVIVRVSWFAAEAGAAFRELDINPLLLGKAGEGAVAVDARLRMAGEQD